MEKEQRKLTLAEQFCYITTIIEAETMDGKKHKGTGFFVTFYTEKGNPFEILVTNRHVAENVKKMRIFISKRGEDGNPVDSEFLPLSIDNVDKIFVFHSDPKIDLAVCPVTVIFNKIRERYDLFYKTFPPSFIVTDEWSCNLDAIEDVIMIGYPLGLYDKTNNRPIVRKGITATDPKVDYEGEKMFMVDIACFPGSSGSPVMVYKKRVVEKTPEATTIKEISKLAGIMCSMTTARNTSLPPNPVSFDLPANIGYAVKAQCLYDFIPLLSKEFDVKLDTSIKR